MGGKVPRLSIESPCDGLFFPRRRIFCLEASRSTCSWPPIIKVNLDQLLKPRHIRLCFFFTATTLFTQVSIWFCLSGCHVLVCFSFSCTMPVSLSDFLYFFLFFFSFLPVSLFWLSCICFLSLVPFSYFWLSCTSYFLICLQFHHQHCLVFVCFTFLRQIFLVFVWCQFHLSGRLASKGHTSAHQGWLDNLLFLSF